MLITKASGESKPTTFDYRDDVGSDTVVSGVVLVTDSGGSDVTSTIASGAVTVTGTTAIVTLDAGTVGEIYNVKMTATTAASAVFVQNVTLFIETIGSIAAYCTFNGVENYVDENMYVPDTLRSKIHLSAGTSRDWINFQLGETSNITPVPVIIVTISNLYAAYIVMSQKQEGQDYDKKSLADVRKKEAIELLRGYAHSTGTTLVMDDAAAAAAEMLSGDSATTSPEIAFGTMDDSAMY